MNHFISQLLAAALTAVNPDTAVCRCVRRDNDRLIIAERLDRPIDGDVRCVALGKASVPMARAIDKILGEDISQGLIVTKSAVGEGQFPAGWDVIEAGHPTPDNRSIYAGTQVWNFLQDLTDRTLILACISGGASALVTAPRSWYSLQQLLSTERPELSPQMQAEIVAKLTSQQIDLATVDPTETISLAAMQIVNTALLNSGLDIQRINAIRSQLDRLKGGGLVDRAFPASVIGLILSDVIGDSIGSIASGLTDRPTAENILVGSNSQACIAVAKAAQKLGYNPQIVTTELDGEAQMRGREIAREIVTKPLKTVLIYGGETTVTISSEHSGKGGRNQELALAAAIELSKQTTPAWVVTLATDGTDGPTDVAGARVNDLTISRSIELGLDAMSALDRHDSYPFLDRLGILDRIGATGTNVADITIAIRP